MEGKNTKATFHPPEIVNFIIKLFLELPNEVKERLHQQIIATEPGKSLACANAEAGIFLFNLFNKNPKNRQRFLRETGWAFTDFYLTGEHTPIHLWKYFNENLQKNGEEFFVTEAVSPTATNSAPL